MKKVLFVVAFVLFACFGRAQNLVPNPSFEDTVTCPNSLSQIDRAVGWSSYRQTPDYYNVCDNGSVGIPMNSFGYQNALNGNAYAGFATHSGNLREYIGVQLIQNLDSGTKYFVSFYVSRGVASYANLAINKIGAKFSTIPFPSANQPIYNSAQIFTDSVIEDTINWVKISGSFIADSAYGYLSIGDFFNDSSTIFIDYDSTGGTAYYYLDCVCISSDSLTCNRIVSINENNINLPIDFFPNPARDWIAIRGNDIQSLSFYDVLGRVVYNNNSEFISPIRINVSSFPNGLYLLCVKTKSQTIIRKIIINN